MAQMLVRDLEPAIVERLKQRAQTHGRSLQKEVKAILEDAAAQYSMDEVQTMLAEWHEKFEGRTFSDSTDLIREDRER